MKTTTTLKRIISVFFAAFVMNTVMGQVLTPHAEWLFDDAADLTKASVGVDLVLVGTDEASAGPEAGDGAAKIGSGSHYKFAHGLAPEAGQSKINTYSISYQFKVPEIGEWVSFLQTDQTNSNDGDLFLRNVNGIGIAAVAYSSVHISPNQWYQLILVVDNGNEFSLYLDSKKILTGTPQSVDGRFALDDEVLFFGDDNGDDNPIYVSQMSFYKQALTQEDINDINGVVKEEVSPYAEWLFDDAADLTKASVGVDLVLVGTDEASAGPEAGDGAAKIGLGSHYKFAHGLAPEAGQSKINTYSISYQFKVPEIGEWVSFLQTDQTNSNDGDLFLRPANGIGIAAVAYGDTHISPAQWYQLILVVDNGNEFSLYLDNRKILSGTPQSVDGRFALEDTVLLFGDNDGEDHPIVVSQVSFYKQALTQEDVNAINGVVTEDGPFLTVPYLQNASTSAMTIMCETDVEQAATVRYGTAPTSLDDETTSTMEQTIGYETYVHKARLTGLSPATTYYYSVTVSDFTSDTLSFKTFTDDNNASFSVGMWSDSHYALPWKPMADYMVEDLGVDFAFNTGDLSNDGSIRGDLLNVFLPHVCERIGSRIPFFSALGNHDVGDWKGGDLIRQYLDSPAEVNSDPEAFSGSFLMMHANVAFISIDWTRMDSDLIPDAWLEQTLQRSDVQNARFRFIYIHCAPYYERWQVGEKAVVKNNIPALATKYNVDAVISGHTHIYERGFKDGVTYITQGGAAYYMDKDEPVGPTLYDHIIIGKDKPDNPVGFNNGETNHFTSLHIDGDNAEIKLHYFTPAGEYEGVMETVDLREIGTSNREHSSVGLQIIHHRPSGIVSISCEEPVMAEVFDIKGNKVKTTSGFSQEVQIDTSGMPAGTYILWINTENGWGTSKKLLIE